MHDSGIHTQWEDSAISLYYAIASMGILCGMCTVAYASIQQYSHPVGSVADSTSHHGVGVGGGDVESGDFDEMRASAKAFINSKKESTGGVFSIRTWASQYQPSFSYGNLCDWINKGSGRNGGTKSKRAADQFKEDFPEAFGTVGGTGHADDRKRCKFTCPKCGVSVSHSINGPHGGGLETAECTGCGTKSQICIPIDEPMLTMGDDEDRRERAQQKVSSRKGKAQQEKAQKEKAMEEEAEAILTLTLTLILILTVILTQIPILIIMLVLFQLIPIPIPIPILILIQVPIITCRWVVDGCRWSVDGV